jgi:hypothetical protein
MSLASWWSVRVRSLLTGCFNLYCFSSGVWGKNVAETNGFFEMEDNHG